MESDIGRELLLDDQHRLWFTTYKGLNWISLDTSQGEYIVEGFSNELEDGWKAALGEGQSVAEKILNFEKLAPTETEPVVVSSTFTSTTT